MRSQKRFVFNLRRSEHLLFRYFAELVA